MNSIGAPAGKARLVNLLDDEEVRFDYNPTEIGLVHDADASITYHRTDSPTGSSGANVNLSQSTGSTRLQFSQLIFVGRQCREKVDLLCAWVLPNLLIRDRASATRAANPASSTSSRAVNPPSATSTRAANPVSSVLAGAAPPALPQTKKRPPLKFEWGAAHNGFDFEVELMRFDCSYTRFSPAGMPVRAEVRNLTLHLVTHDLKEFAGNGFSRDVPAGAPGRNSPMGDPLRSAAPPRLKMGSP
ncbi:hypothetical protein AB0D30_30940 [Streptomyces sp. NPDC048409]|uniref:hypothetical protein n=1 Tax=Streptomyces sp. NPDC048409 TaxID=3154723 RepID=UPI00343B154F